MRPFELDHSETHPLFLKKVGSRPCDVGRSNHRELLVQRIKKARNHTAADCRSNVPRGIFHEPRRPQKHNWRWQISKRSFDDGVLREQIGQRRLRADGREVNDSARACRFER